MAGEGREHDGALVRPARRAGVLRAAVARTLGRFLARYEDLPRDTMLAEAGVEPTVLADPNGWLSVSAVARLLDGASSLSRDSALGLGFARQLPWNDLGVLANLALTSPTVGAGLANISRYFGTTSTGASMWLDIDGRHAHLRYGIHDPEIELHAQNSEFVFAVITRMAREATGDPTWAPGELQFRHPRPANTTAQRAFFRCRMRFEQPFDALVLPAPRLRERFHRADATRHSHHVEAANRVLPDERALFGERVSAIVLSGLRTGELTLDGVAARLGTSTRTLQRRLREDGRSFQDVVAHLRSVAARRYVSDPAIPLTAVAARLGYTELSAFSRAFRRWTGQTPLEYRRGRRT